MSLKHKQKIAFYKKQEMYLRGCNDKLSALIRTLETANTGNSNRNDDLIVECNELIIENNQEIKYLSKAVYDMATTEA